MERRRPIFSEPSETMRSWAEALRSELAEWPQVALKRSFGMVMAYRGEAVFAALPGTRALYAEDGILIKFLRESPRLAARLAADPHFAPGTMESSRKPGSEGRKWRIFLMKRNSDVHAALEWLAEAYRLAGR